MRKGILFDLDGTLWDATKCITDSWNQTIANHSAQKPVTHEQMVSMMGLSMDQIQAKIFPDLEFEEQSKLARLCEQEENEYVRIHGGKLYPHLEEVLQQLHQEYFLAIISNCQQGYIEAFLDNTGFWKYFDDIECYGNTLEPKDKNIRRVIERNRLDQVVYLGDIQSDLNAAMKAEVPFIWASYGFGKLDHPIKIDDLTGLPAIVPAVLNEN